MNYSHLFKSLKKEVALSCQYKLLETPFKTMAVIATIPFWIMYGIQICLEYVYLFIYNASASSSDYLEGWVKETKKGTQHLTEAVIYLVTMPVIFFFRVFLSIYSVAFYFMWFFTMCVAYIATLGGIRWQPFISTATYSDSIKVEATTNESAGNAIVIIGFVLFCLWFLLYIIGIVSSDIRTINASNIISDIYWLFMVIAVPLTFKHKIIGENANNSKEESESSKELEEEFPDF